MKPCTLPRCHNECDTHYSGNEGLIKGHRTSLDGCFSDHGSEQRLVPRQCENGRFLPESLAERIIAMLSQFAFEDPTMTYDPVQARHEARTVLEAMTK